MREVDRIGFTSHTILEYDLVHILITQLIDFRLLESRIRSNLVMNLYMI